ncbi:vesicular integral-membrane protein vip36 [Colletotrichum tofieldiae]|nr:vesicular integral-membrane protein vip36 [Colletotrichum tofieldiae]
MWFKQSLSALWLAAMALGTAKADDGEVKSIAPYLDSDMASRWYDFGGDTIIRTDSYIRLTSDRPSQTGWLFSRVPLTATNWEIEVEFKIHGKNQLYGDGFAMWVTKNRGQAGPVFGSPDNFEGLGIFFDTYKNNRPGTVFPYVMAMFGDGKTTYDKDNDGKNTELAGCSARGIRHASVPTKAKITYFQDKLLKLELQYKSEGEWTHAETGELSDNHDIISVQAKNLYTTQAGKSNSKTTPGSGKGKKGSSIKKESGGGGSWTWTFFKIFLFFGVLGGGYVGYTAWRAKSDKRHRF